MSFKAIETVYNETEGKKAGKNLQSIGELRENFK